MLHAAAGQARAEASKKRSGPAASLPEVETSDLMPRGNQARLRTLAGGAAMQRPSQMPMLQRKCACGGACPDCGRKDKLQRKAAISEPGDALEQEADRVADQVMRMSASSVQRRAEARNSTQSRKGGGTPTGVPPIVGEILRSPGEPLDTETRSFMEPRFDRSFEDRDHDFGGVRVHTGANADASARAVNALAYTVGSDIVFAAGQYAPTTSRGQKLLAHELSHTVQQNQGSARSLPGPETVIQRQPQGGMKTTGTPSPVAGGNVLYIGMNNYKPEVARLKTRFAGTSVKVTTVTVTEEEKKSQAGTSTYDLTTTAGVSAFANSLSLSAGMVGEVEKVINDRDAEDRDDLAHVISVYSQTQQDGADRMSRVVLSGHSAGWKVYNEDVKGAVWFESLVKLAGIFPAAAAQTKHLLVLACYAGEQDVVKNYYTKAFPSLQTFWGYTSSCPTGAGAAAKLAKWADITDVNPTKLEMPPSGQGNWAMGVYQSDEPINGPAIMTGLRSDEATFNAYFAGTKVDPDNHSGFLFAYYGRARTAALHTSTITGADHDYAQLHADQSFRLRFWTAMVSNFWKKNGAVITRGYGTATVPKFANMSRKDTLAAIANFDSTSTATAADKDAAARLLKALGSLDASLLSDNWITP